MVIQSIWESRESPAFAPPAACHAGHAGPGHAVHDSLGIEMNLAGNVSSFWVV